MATKPAKLEQINENPENQVLPEKKSFQSNTYLKNKVRPGSKHRIIGCTDDGVTSKLEVVQRNLEVVTNNSVIIQDENVEEKLFTGNKILLPDYKTLAFASVIKKHRGDASRSKAGMLWEGSNNLRALEYSLNLVDCRNFCGTSNKLFVVETFLGLSVFQ